MGFIDISQRPKTLTVSEHKKLLSIQNYLKHVESHKEYFKKFNSIQWQKSKELSANYQQIILQHFNL